MSNSAPYSLSIPLGGDSRHIATPYSSHLLFTHYLAIKGVIVGIMFTMMIQGGVEEIFYNQSFFQTKKLKNEKTNHLVLMGERFS